MKRKILILCFATAITICACGSKETVIEKQATEKNVDNETESKAQSEDLQSKKGILNVEITIPSDFYNDMTKEEIEENLSDFHYGKVTVNDDKSVTMKMSKAEHKKMMIEIKEEMTKSMDDMVNGENKTESFDKITFNDDVTEFSVFVDGSKYSEMDSFQAFSFYMSGMFYQLLNCVPEKDIDVKVDFIDKDTNEVLNSGKLSDAQNKESEPDKIATEKDTLREIEDWYTSDIWNNFVNFQAYRESGKDCTGSEIDIDFAYSQFKEKYALKDKYNDYISKLSDDYSSVKDDWSKMNEQIDLIYSELEKNGVEKGGERLELDLLSQYSNAFYDDVSNIK